MYPHSNGGPAGLTFFYGTMECGKSVELLQTAYNYHTRGMSVRIIKPSIDTKGDATVVSRIGLQRPVDLLAGTTDDLLEYLAGEHRHDQNLRCVLVDEAQFLAREQVDQLLRATVELALPVICYGLRSDFQTNGFPGSLRLFEVATVLQELRNGICQCGSKSIFNARKQDGRFVAEGSQVAIDGEGEVTYEPLCVACYLNKVGIRQAVPA